MSTLTVEPILREREHRWPVGCRVTRQGPLTTIAIARDFDVTDIAGLDRTAALTIDLPGLDMLVVDLCELDDVDDGLLAWLRRVDAWAKLAGAAVVVLGESSRTIDAVRALPVRALRGSASIV